MTALNCTALDRTPTRLWALANKKHKQHPVSHRLAMFKITPAQYLLRFSQKTQPYT